MLTTQPTADVTIGAQLERHDRRHGQPAEPDVHPRQLERAADGHGDRRRRRRGRRRRRLHDRDRRGDQRRRELQRLDAADVAVTNTDNDAAGITVTPTTGLTTTEAGGTATFTVVLQPADGGRDDRADSSDTTEGTVSRRAS